ncbi:hypothetical protein G7Z17_g9468 [Cylindrodendrum hubeiense]|uniref:PhnB-like domain-containing protein n=1 Tax=Cylindrodendrum hubeiense TaxID=595255 RepID=A0A9P5GZF1_9HYPO|nr:hypothetical protein G7Z17_g9468 [Cylindrodendrum hubeiense]
MSITKIRTCLWFDDQAEEAANHYISTFGGDSKIVNTQNDETGSIMLVEFELRGTLFLGLNGGRAKWSFNEAISFQVECEDQAEIDHFWEKLGEGGDESRRQCGWIADKYGISWQVMPKSLKMMLSPEDKAAAGRVTVAMMKMTKIDVDLLEKAFRG